MNGPVKFKLSYSIHLVPLHEMSLDRDVVRFGSRNTLQRIR